MAEDPEQQFGLYHSAYCLELSTAEKIGDWQLGPCNVAIFSPSLESIYYDCGGDYLTEIHRLDLQTGRDAQLLQADLMFVKCLAITPNEHLLAIGGLERTDPDFVVSVRRLDVMHGTLLEPIHTFAVCLAYSPNGQMLAVGGQSAQEMGESGELRDVRVFSGRRLMQEYAIPAIRLAWSPHGRLAWGMDTQLSIARPGVDEPVRSWDGPSGKLSALDFSSDGRLLLTSTYCGTCALHDPDVGEMRTVFDWGIGPVHSVAFSPDGLTCAAGGENGRVVVWDVDE